MTYERISTKIAKDHIWIFLVKEDAGGFLKTGGPVIPDLAIQVVIYPHLSHLLFCCVDAYNEAVLLNQKTKRQKSSRSSI